MPKGLLVIPNYNQAVELPALLTRLARFYPLRDVVFIDDGSTDNSVDIAREQGLKVIEHKQNLGIGAAIRTGINFAKQANYDFVCMFSANGKMLPEEISTVLRPIIDGKADYVIGSRFREGGTSPGLPYSRRLLIRLFSLGSCLFFNRLFSDITCGFRAYRLSVLADSRIDLEKKWLNRYELEYYIHFWFCKKKVKLVEIPVTISYQHLEKERRSKIVPFFDWWRIIRTLLLLRLGAYR